MADEVFPAYKRIVLNNHNRFESLIRQGVLKPVFLWHFPLLIVLPIAALLVPHKKGGYYVRSLLFVATLSLGADILRSRRMRLGANGYMVGLIVIWWFVWCATLLFFNDPEHNFQRIERARHTSGKTPHGQGNGVAIQEGNQGPNPGNMTAETLVWQPYPQTFPHRLNWVLGLVFNMRGPEWNWRISCLDPLPSHLVDSARHASHRQHKQPPFPRAKSRVRTALTRFIISYLCIDLLKLIMIRDPWFFNAVPTPPPFPFNHLSETPGLVRVYRLLLSGTGIFLALQFVTALNPLFFLGLSLAFPTASRALTSVPLDAPWLYAPPFGSLAAILEHGLAGVWGRWWHQIFRFGFTSTAKWIISFLPSHLAARRRMRRTIMTLVAFGISGLMHSAGSYTQLGDTQPVSGTFLFFLLQAVGIFVQELYSWAVAPWLSGKNCPPAPTWLSRAANAGFVLGWLLFSGRYIADDFARGGIWLTEPLPFSLVRGLSGQGWLCWQSAWFEYYDDGTYWGRGVRIL
ncbi:hypothetical protein ARAM_005764 [Aspergillus rambellii]|uniref:Wax synthase domain-containing protein n=1 Tax=Aspergillus rambellii TaxID=308745 RepID=A0A0F8WFP8_9EURO|nr:hypothetical protein ARAM_005764 [Aspergillus rambellii]